MTSTIFLQSLSIPIDSGESKYHDATSVDSRTVAAKLDPVAIGVGRNVSRRQQRCVLVAAQSWNGGSRRSGSIDFLPIKKKCIGVTLSLFGSMQFPTYQR